MEAKFQLMTLMNTMHIGKDDPMRKKKNLITFVMENQHIQ